MLTQFKLALLCFVFERTDGLMSELCAKDFWVKSNVLLLIYKPIINAKNQSMWCLLFLLKAKSIEWSLNMAEWFEVALL